MGPVLDNSPAQSGSPARVAGVSEEPVNYARFVGRPPLLSEQEVARLVTRFPSWEQQNAAMVTTLRFPDFERASGFIESVVEISEDLEHHPEWSNSNLTVMISTTTNDLGGLTELDAQLMERVDQAARDYDAY